MDNFPADLIMLGVTLNRSLSYLSVSWNEPFLFIFRFCVPCIGICSTNPATKHYYGHFQQKAHGSHMGRRVVFLTCHKLSFKGVLFKGSYCCLSAKLLPGAFKVLHCPHCSYTEFMTVERSEWALGWTVRPIEDDSPEICDMLAIHSLSSSCPLPAFHFLVTRHLCSFR